MDVIEDLRELAVAKRTIYSELTPEQLSLLKSFPDYLPAYLADAIADWLDERAQLRLDAQS